MAAHCSRCVFTVCVCVCVHSVCVFTAVCVQSTNSEYGSLWLPTALGVCSQCVGLCVFVFTALCVQSINSEYGSPWLPTALGIHSVCVCVCVCMCVCVCVCVCACACVCSLLVHFTNSEYGSPYLATRHVTSLSLFTFTFIYGSGKKLYKRTGQSKGSKNPIPSFILMKISQLVKVYSSKHGSQSILHFVLRLI